MKQLRAILALVAITLSACAAGESTPGPSSTAIASTTDGAAPSESGSLPSASADAVTPGTALYPPVVAAPTGLLPPGSVARVTAQGLRVRAGPPGSADHGQIIYSLSAGDLVLVGSNPLAYVPPEGSSDGRGWYEVHVGGAEVLSYADGGINGWVAEGDGGLEWLAAEALMCRGADTLAGVLSPPEQGGKAHEWATAWDQLACYGGGQLHLEGVIDFQCFEGSMLPFDLSPYHLAAPVMCTGLIPDGSADFQTTGIALGLRFREEWGAYPHRGELVRIAGHFDDPASSTCTIKPGDISPPPFDAEFLILFCRERFVVDELAVIGHRDLAPLPWE